ncbi:MAG: 30S ribosomal protein S4, partial [Candidatus Odinarchaeota archaeon]
MGGIRKPKKKYIAPGHPWQKTRLAEELIYVGEYGLRNKRELWRHRTLLARFRGTARDLVALPVEERITRESQLLGRINRLALIDKHSQLDDILDLTIRDMLERRLQTQVVRQGLAKTMHHARQLIVHGHISLDGHRVTSPGMLLYRDLEKKLEYTPNSPYR